MLKQKRYVLVVFILAATFFIFFFVGFGSAEDCPPGSGSGANAKDDPRHTTPIPPDPGNIPKTPGDGTGQGPSILPGAGQTPSTIPGDWTVSPEWDLACDPSNPEEIEPGESITISVKGGRPIYTWSVSGNGFSLEHEKTKGLSNTLHAVSPACEACCCAAEITVVDATGATVTCSVRCSNGTWVEVCSGPECCYVSGPGDFVFCDTWFYGSEAEYKLIQGKYKVEQTTLIIVDCIESVGINTCEQPSSKCEDSPAYCADIFYNGISNCIDPDHTIPCYTLSNNSPCYWSATGREIACARVEELKAFEWTCPP